MNFGTRVQVTADVWEMYDWDEAPKIVCPAGKLGVIEGKLGIGFSPVHPPMDNYLVVYRTDGFEESWWIPELYLRVLPPEPWD